MAWSLLVGSVVLGLLLSAKVRPGRVTPAWLTDLHRFLGGLAVVFVGVHVGAIVLDSYVPFGITDVLVPLASSWHPVWVAWGIVSMYLLLAVEITSLLRRRMPKRMWRRVHYLSFALLVTVTIHFLLVGTDAGSPVAMVAIVGAALLVGGLVGLRIIDARRPLGARPAPIPRPVPSPIPPTWEPQAPVASSQPLTVPNRGESRCAPSAVHEERPWPQA